MNAGRLKEVITIQKPTISQNEYGANGTQWTDYITTRSDVQFESGNRHTENGDIVFNYTKIVTIKYDHNIDEKDRILWKGKLYRILSVEPDRDKQSIIIRTELIND